MIITDSWKSLHFGASVGLLAVRNVINPQQHDALEQKKNEIENNLRKTFPAREALLNFEPVAVYMEYYRRYKKTYHVLQQMESVIFKDKSIPSIAALVEAMFMAELKNGVLTAGHDLDLIQMPLQLDASGGTDTYIGINGKEQIAKAGDMLMSDAAGIISSILGGPDLRTKITGDTRNALFVVYAPAGISSAAIEAHFDDLISNIRIFSNDVVVGERRIYR